MRNLSIWISVIFFIAAGVLIFGYRQLNAPLPIVPAPEQPKWQLEIKVNFLPLRNPLLINWQLPSDNNGYRIIDEFFITKGYGVETDENRPLIPRNSRWSKQYSLNNQTVFYRAIISQDEASSKYKFTEEEMDQLKKKYLEAYAETTSAQSLKQKLSTRGQEVSPMAMSVEQLLDSIRQKTIAPKIFVRRLVRALEQEEFSTNALVQSDIEPLRNTLEVAWALSNYSGIPTRIANGIAVSDQEGRYLPIVRWIEVLDEEEGRWERVLTAEDDKQVRKRQLFALWYGKLDMLSIPNGLRESYVVSLEPANYISSQVSNEDDLSPPQKLLSMINFGQLPVGSQILLKFLLVIPIGTLILAVARQFIGIKTFGTFMPILIALSFKETGLMIGLGLLGGVVIAGLLTRSYLAKLQLLFVPRISAVMTILILLIAVLALFFENTRIESGLAIFLFPIVILVMLIERLALVLDEAGPDEAMATGFGTLLVVLACYFVMNTSQVRYFFFTFPETLLIIVGIHILLGRYAGFRLTEYVRFQDLITRKPNSP